MRLDYIAHIYVGGSSMFVGAYDTEEKAQFEAMNQLRYYVKNHKGLTDKQFDDGLSSWLPYATEGDHVYPSYNTPDQMSRISYYKTEDGWEVAGGVIISILEVQ